MFSPARTRHRESVGEPTGKSWKCMGAPAAACESSCGIPPESSSVGKKHKSGFHPNPPRWGKNTSHGKMQARIFLYRFRTSRSCRRHRTRSWCRRRLLKRAHQRMNSIAGRRLICRVLQSEFRSGLGTGGSQMLHRTREKEA